MDGLSADMISLATAASQRAWAALTTPSSTLSVVSLLTAGLVGALWVARRRRLTHGRRVRSARVLARALFPRRWSYGPSARADWTFAAFNILFYSILFSGAVLSAVTVADAVSAALSAGFGPRAAPLLTGWPAGIAITLLLYIAFEAGYFLDHLLKHKVPLLWHFHRTHHLAETLGPATFQRLHPVDLVIFSNIIALFMGGMTGLCAWALPGIDQWSLWGGNAALALAAYLVTPLQHSQLWIPATGWLGKVILSPAHHQIHHSADPVHHDRNFGSTLALFDWAAGTLCVPTAKRQRLTFGAGPYPVNPHSLWGAWVQPFIEAFRTLRGRAGDVTPGERATPR